MFLQLASADLFDAFKLCKNPSRYMNVAHLLQTVVTTSLSAMESQPSCSRPLKKTNKLGRLLFGTMVSVPGSNYGINVAPYRAAVTFQMPSALQPKSQTEVPKTKGFRVLLVRVKLIKLG